MGERGKPLTRSKYPSIYKPEHPLAWKDGRVRAHRAALFDRIGPGSHPCNWCNTTVTWSGNPELVTDHVDGNTWNNNPDNLVPSCPPCNATRTILARTHCKYGHEYTPENTYWRKNPGRNSTRMCRTCSRERGRRKRVEVPEQRGRESVNPPRLNINPIGLTLGGLRQWINNADHIDDDTPVYVAFSAEAIQP